MRTEELDYELPEELIAQEPAIPRDSSRLLVCGRDLGNFETRIFHELPDLLNSGDILVTNQARVMPARMIGYKFPTGAKIEVFLLEPDIHSQKKSRFKALLKRRRRLSPGDTILFPETNLVATVIECDEEPGKDIVELGTGDKSDQIEKEIEKIGQVPLPPYIKDYKGDMERYQTIFSKITGSVAAPTASLHFTDRVLEKLDLKGVLRVECHLRVGWGTFSPIRTEKLEDHTLHEEAGELTKQACDKINNARTNGGRIIAVGTTMTRLLETAADKDGVLHPYKGRTDLYITPGYRFRAVDVLLTNFHLPKTSLLALVSAFMGVERTLEAYEFAVKEKFRFYSFGDAMLII